jgi:hypothetical protein
MSVRHMGCLKHIRQLINVCLDSSERIFSTAVVPDTVAPPASVRKASNTEWSPHIGNILEFLIGNQVDMFMDINIGEESNCGRRSNNEVAYNSSGNGTRYSSSRTSQKECDALVMQDIDDNIEKGYLDALEEKNEDTSDDQISTSAVSEKKSSDGKANLHTMSLSELRSLKKSIKEKLVAFDIDFKKKRGHMPSKADKEPIRHLYVKYNEVKNMLTDTSGGVGVESKADGRPQSADSASSKKVNQALGGNTKTLLAEKRALQSKLREYEKKFEVGQGRKVKYHKDISPVEADYQRYKVLKTMLKQAGYISTKSK